MRRVAGILLPLCALCEIGVGVVVVLFPATFAWILLGATIDGASLVIARMAGIGIAAMGLAWWVARNRLEGPGLRQVAVSFIVYNLGVGLTLVAYAWGASQSLPLALLAGVVHLLAGLTFVIAATRSPES
jgi:hypothetical protein